MGILILDRLNGRDLDRLNGRDGNGVDGLVVPGRSMVVAVMIKSR